MIQIATQAENGLAELAKEINGELAKSLDARDSALVERLTKQFNDELTKRTAELEARAARFSLPGSAEAKEKGQPYSFRKAYMGVLTGDFRHCPMEAEMSEQLRSKAMSFSVDASGGFLVPNEVLVSQVIPLLYANSVCAELGATQLNGLTRAPVQIPRVSGGTTAYWVGEAASITASDLSLQQVSLSPHGLAAMTVVSDQLLAMESGGIESMLLSDMARQLALKLDLACLAGTGASGQPIGINVATGVNTSSLTDPATYNELVAFIGEVRADNALSGSLGWAVSNADMVEIEQIADTDRGTSNASSQVHERRRLLSEDGQSLLGYPVKVSTQLTDGQVIFGNWADLLIAQWGGMRLDRTNAVNFATAQTNIRAMSWFDVGIRHPESFCRKT